MNVVKTNRLKDGAQRYGVAVFSVTVGVAVRSALRGDLASVAPYVTFFPAITLAAWFGGLGPGLLATILSLLAAFYFVIPPFHRLYPSNLADGLSAVMFGAFSVFICVLNEALRRSSAKSEERFQQLKSAEEALRESQGRLRAIYDGTYEYILLLTPEGVVLEANHASLTFAESGREEFIGKQFWELPWFLGSSEAQGAAKAGMARAEAGEFVRFEAVLRRPSGEQPTFDISLYPVKNEQGRVVLIVPEARDITELKSTEQELKKTNQELMRANRELEEFAYVASHDLQEPLRTVNIYTQLLLRRIGNENADIASYGSYVRQGVSRMEALISDLLEYSRTSQMDEQPMGVEELSDSLNPALEALKEAIEESGAVITSDALPAVMVKTSQMTRVFQNLLSNAMKYRNKTAPPVIHISAETEGENWIIAVRDNGIGFEQQYADRIFALFKRLHKTEYPGTGLGLAICQRIVESCGGRIWAEGRPGEGATFYFSLPRAGG